jgi:hypothetical protein
MMSQILSEGIQHKFLLKLLEFDYSIEYKRGAENRVADALSRNEHHIQAISTITPTWMTEIENSYVHDPVYTSLLQQLLVDANVAPHYSIHFGILKYKGRICIGSNTELHSKLLSFLHTSAIGGHSGVTRTYQRIKRIFD